MEYKSIRMPFEFLRFEEMDKKQTEQFFNWFMETKEERLKNLQEYIWNDNRDVILDKTPESLMEVWKWFQQKICWENKSDEELREELENRPGWMREIVLANTQKISVSTLRIAYDISVYFGDVLIANHTNLYWGVLRKPKQLDGVNSPRVMGFVGDQSAYTYGLIDVCIRRSSRCPNENQLFELYEIWSKMVS